MEKNIRRIEWMESKSEYTSKKPERERVDCGLGGSKTGTPAMLWVQKMTLVKPNGSFDSEAIARLCDRYIAYRYVSQMITWEV